MESTNPHVLSDQFGNANDEYYYYYSQGYYCCHDAKEQTQKIDNDGSQANVHELAESPWNHTGGWTEPSRESHYQYRKEDLTTTEEEGGKSSLIPPLTQQGVRHEYGQDERLVPKSHGILSTSIEAEPLDDCSFLRRDNVTTKILRTIDPQITNSCDDDSAPAYARYPPANLSQMKAAKRRLRSNTSTHRAKMIPIDLIIDDKKDHYDGERSCPKSRKKIQEAIETSGPGDPQTSGKEKWRWRGNFADCSRQSLPSVVAAKQQPSDVGPPGPRSFHVTPTRPDTNRADAHAAMAFGGIDINMISPTILLRGQQSSKPQRPKLPLPPPPKREVSLPKEPPLPHRVTRGGVKVSLQSPTIAPPPRLSTEKKRVITPPTSEILPETTPRSLVQQPRVATKTNCDNVLARPADRGLAVETFESSGVDISMQPSTVERQSATVERVVLSTPERGSEPSGFMQQEAQAPPRTTANVLATPTMPRTQAESLVMDIVGAQVARRKQPTTTSSSSSTTTTTATTPVLFPGESPLSDSFLSRLGCAEFARLPVEALDIPTGQVSRMFLSAREALNFLLTSAAAGDGRRESNISMRALQNAVCGAASGARYYQGYFWRLVSTTHEPCNTISHQAPALSSSNEPFGGATITAGMSQEAFCTPVAPNNGPPEQNPPKRLPANDATPTRPEKRARTNTDLGAEVSVVTSPNPSTGKSLLFSPIVIKSSPKHHHSAPAMLETTKMAEAPPETIKQTQRRVSFAADTLPRRRLSKPERRILKLVRQDGGHEEATALLLMDEQESPLSDRFLQRLPRHIWRKLPVEQLSLSTGRVLQVHSSIESVGFKQLALRDAVVGMGRHPYCPRQYKGFYWRVVGTKHLPWASLEASNTGHVLQPDSAA